MIKEELRFNNYNVAQLKQMEFLKLYGYKPSIYIFNKGTKSEYFTIVVPKGLQRLWYEKLQCRF